MLPDIVRVALPQHYRPFALPGGPKGGEAFVIEMDVVDPAAIEAGFSSWSRPMVRSTFLSTMPA
jgi:hypothetical protein